MRTWTVLGVTLWLSINGQCWAKLMYDEPTSTVFVTLLVRDKEHTLPYFLNLFQRLEYSKDRMILWIVSDGNQDQTLRILNKWIPSVEKTYKRIFKRLIPHSEKVLVAAQWTPERFRHVMELKEEALDKARSTGADYIWFLDCDVFLTNKKTLKHLLVPGYPIISPLLDYIDKQVRVQPTKGCVRVPYVHSCYLINLQTDSSRHLTFHEDKIPQFQGPRNDAVVLALSASKHNIPMYRCSDIYTREDFGFMMTPSHESQTIEDEMNQLLNIQMETSIDQPQVVAHPLLTEFVRDPPKDKLEFDEIFVINLRKRPERRQRMEWIGRQLGLDVHFIDAVDGNLLNVTYLNSMGIRMLPEYSDPYKPRPMTMGQVGCFLSHFGCWKKIVEQRLEKVLILEDDVNFLPNFRRRTTALMKEMDDLDLKWDLLYLGRKKRTEAESLVPGSRSVFRAGHSHGGYAYVLSLSGAEKLVRTEPLDRLVPVDEYLPIMFDRHPRPDWSAAFPVRHLQAFAGDNLVGPGLTGGPTQPRHYSDTAELIPEEIRSPAGEKTHNEL